MNASLISDLERLPVKGEALWRGDERTAAYQGDVVMKGDPDMIVRARDAQEVAEILSYCHARKIPVTFMGGQSGLTGASAASSGVVIATERLERVLDISTSPQGQSYAIVEPGILLGDLRSRVEQESLFYPPDPTSFEEARLGGTIATNATGEDTLLYGPTRCYVRQLKVILADGRMLQLKRSIDEKPDRTKGTAGYFLGDSLIDLFIGSEGTLGYIAEATLDLIEDPAEYWAAIGFFPSLDMALEFVTRAMQSHKIVPRALELLDKPSLQIFAEAEGVPPLPDESQAAIYWKQEYKDEKEKTENLEIWYELYSSVIKGWGGEDVWIAETPSKKTQFRKWRHHVPAVINERVNKFSEAGGGKVASDWWVPVSRIQEAIHKAIVDSEEAGLLPIIFSHIGNGHPHVNYLVQNAKERQVGMDLIRRQCERAVRWGGGVAGEHGLGKIYRDLLTIQHSQKVIRKMIEIKWHWDPHWILGRGTLFEVPEC